MTHIEIALRIALEAHEGQTDKAGDPYILHPLRVMQNVKGTDTKIVALLHDVIEDSVVTAQYLLESGFPAHIVRSVETLTKTEGMDYGAYLAEVVKDPVAREVKLADLHDNLALTRMNTVTEMDLPRLNKYLSALEFLDTRQPASVTNVPDAYTSSSWVISPEWVKRGWDGTLRSHHDLQFGLNVLTILEGSEHWEVLTSDPVEAALWFISIRELYASFLKRTRDEDEDEDGILWSIRGYGVNEMMLAVHLGFEELSNDDFRDEVEARAVEEVSNRGGVVDRFLSKHLSNKQLDFYVDPFKWKYLLQGVPEDEIDAEEEPLNVDVDVDLYSDFN